MKTVFIYALKDPITDEIRYIGKSVNPDSRLRTHVCESKREKHHRARWIHSLTVRGLRPVLDIVDETCSFDWPSIECAYIQYYQELGCDLVNGTAGGENPPSSFGVKRSSETCARISARQLGEKNHSYGKKQTPEQIAKKIAGMLGKKHGPHKKCNPRTEEHRANYRRAWKRRTQEKILSELWH